MNLGPRLISGRPSIFPTTGKNMHMCYYEQGKLPAHSRARSEAKCPSQAFPKRGRALTCPTTNRKSSLFVVGHGAKRSARCKCSQKEDGHLHALLRTGKAPLFVVGHEAKRSARLSVHKKRTGTYVPYYERERPFVRSRARSEAECPSKRSQKERARTCPTTNRKSSCS